MDLQHQLLQVLTLPNGNLDLHRLAALTRDTGLIGLLANCVREIAEGDNQMFFP